MENFESTDQGCPFARFVPPQVFTCVHGVIARKARGTLHGVCCEVIVIVIASSG